MNQDKRHQVSVEKELKVVARQEQALHRAATRQKTPRWKTELRDKVPEKVYDNLEKAFCKAFELVFDKGTGWIEKTYNAQAMRSDHAVHDFAFQVKADRKSLKNLRRDAKGDTLRSMFVTGAEGIGLGVLGIGLPDIVLFVGMLLQGMYKTALHYGFAYDTPEERYFILLLMQTAMQKGSEWEACDHDVEQLMQAMDQAQPVTLSLDDQRTRTAQAFAADMVVSKFIQGLPLVGVIGGATNPIYYNRVMKYAELKYRKRYLLGLRKTL